MSGRRRTGFTLLELVIVISISAVVLTIAGLMLVQGPAHRKDQKTTLISPE